MSDTDRTDAARLARILAWFVAVPLFVAAVITILLEFDVTADPPKQTPPNDIFEGTLAFFENETERWPQELISVILFIVGLVALIGLVVLLRDAVTRRSPSLMLGTLVIGVGAAIGVAGQLFYIGAKEIAIDPQYCDCARRVEQIVSRGQALDIIESAQQWMLLGFFALASLGFLLIWRAVSEHGLFSGAWRGVTLVLALVLIVGVVAFAFDLELLSDLFVAVAAAILAPVWAFMTARQLSSA